MSNLRLAVRGVRASASASARALSTVADVTVTVNFVDFEGTQHTVPGRIGMKLTEVASMHGLDNILHGDSSEGGVYNKVHSDEWTEDLFGEGTTSNLSHVIVPGNWMEKLTTPTEKEIALLEDLADDVRSPNSRIGAEIALTKELDGITVWCPDSPPWEIP